MIATLAAAGTALMFVAWPMEVWPGALVGFVGFTMFAVGIAASVAVEVS